MLINQQKPSQKPTPLKSPGRLVSLGACRRLADVGLFDLALLGPQAAHGGATNAFETSWDLLGATRPGNLLQFANLKIAHRNS